MDNQKMMKQLSVLGQRYRAMSPGAKNGIFATLAVLLTVVAFLIESGLLMQHADMRRIANFQRQLHQKELRLQRDLDQAVKLFENNNFWDNFLTDLAPVAQRMNERGSAFLAYNNDRLFYWSNHNVAFGDLIPSSVDSVPRLLILPNGFYLTRTAVSGNMSFVGLMLIKNNFPHENEYLVNDFAGGLSLPADYRIIMPGTTFGQPVTDIKGEVLFSLQPEGVIACSITQLYLPGLLYFAGLILMILFFRKLFAQLGLVVGMRLILMASLLFFLYWVHITFRFPRIFYQLDLFSPAQFAYNFWLPSLGDFLLISAAFFYFMLSLYKELRLGVFERSTGIPRRSLLFGMLLTAGAIYLLVDYFMRELIYNSSVQFTLNKINEISPPTFIGLASVMLLLFGLILLTARIAIEAQHILKGSITYLVFPATATVLMATQLLLGFRVSWQPMVMFAVISSITMLLSPRGNQRHALSFLVLIISITTVYTLQLIYSTTVSKEREIQKLLAVSLVAEHDPAAEVFLAEIQEQIYIDPNIPGYLLQPYEVLEEYLERTYFSGFFRQYDLQITICTGSDSLILHPNQEIVPCFPFFDEMIGSYGYRLPGTTSFYFLDNLNGRISYFGHIHYPLTSDSIGVSIFLELNSNIPSEGIGFPELLIDQSVRKTASYRRFDHANYYGGELVDRHGNYPYNYYIYAYDIGEGEFVYRTWDNYEHLIYSNRDDNYVMVSRSLYSFVDYLISFPYLFVFYLIFSIVTLLLIRPAFKTQQILFDLKFKIQAAIISIVFVSLLLVALGSVFYHIEEYKLRLQDDLNAKMHSVSTEIDLRLGSVNAITPEVTEWLSRELVELSNIFLADINIYSAFGDLLVSSRPEIFNKGLVSRKISTQAYQALYEQYQVNFSQPEQIGRLKFLSAYAPIINNNGEYLGFINLPYFTQQDRYRQEISTFIVAFINLYVLLFLASILLAVFISKQITRPLAAIRENLRKIELGKRNEPINYAKDDEIGNLVREYNKKVDELAVSADLLARSERESAWREMAKQIAHEIKNPLTPMKLNIQHLQRFSGNETTYREAVNRVADTLIAQIDSLSEIATEFSNFAKIPGTRKQIFNLGFEISKTVELYENDHRVKVVFNSGDCGETKVNADPEQLSRALINLIKNGIQAIPPDREGIIHIGLMNQDPMVVISVTDNGSGIAEPLRERMFSPNFTTKTSGMGLGLAIVKSIAENFHGRVWFETQTNEGTTFYLAIPVYMEVV